MLGRKARKSSIAPPAYHGELVTVTMPSGYVLSVTVMEPRSSARGTAILLHSMMASRRIFHAPCKGRGFAQALVDCGLRILSVDFRGHGESVPRAADGGAWNYDDLVREDLPVVVRAAREWWPNERLCAVGHSLGGHVGLAAAATAKADLDAVVMVASSIWVPELDTNPAHRAKKGALLRTARAVTGVRGFFPARALGLGSDDESAGFIRAIYRFWTKNAWVSEDGTIDYMASLAGLRVPVMSVASVGDRYMCAPETAHRFARRVGANVTFELVRLADDGSPAPDHMELVTTRAAESMWQRVGSFCTGV